MLARWQGEYPRVELRINLEATRQPIPALLAGALDLALTTDAPRHARLSRAPLFADELVLLVPAAHPLARRRHATAQDLSREHLLVYDAPREQLDVFTRVLWPAGVEPRRVSRVPLTEALVELVRGGAGVTPLASWVLPARRQGLATVRLTPDGIERRWSCRLHGRSAALGSAEALRRAAARARPGRGRDHPEAPAPRLTRSRATVPPGPRSV